MKVAMSIAFTEYACQYSAGLFAGKIIAGYQSLEEEFMNTAKKDLGRWESLEMVQSYTRSVTFEDCMKHYKAPLPQ